VLGRFQFDGSDGRGFWLVIGLLLLAVLVPTAALLYFINLAVVNERNITRRQLGEAYSGQLRAVAARIDQHWDQLARDLDGGPAGELPAEFFERAMRSGMVDSVICFQRDGSPGYPSLAAPPRADPTRDQPRWIEARTLEDSGKFDEAAAKYAAIAEGDRTLAAVAWRAVVRCLATSGQKEAALRTIDEQFDFAGVMALARDFDGRAIAADELLLYLHLLPPGDKRFQRHAQYLHNLLQNYGRPIPSPQRLFLMDFLRALVPESDDLHKFRTYQAERVAERVLSDGHATPGDTALRFSGSADIYKFTSASGRRLALFRTAGVFKTMERYLVPGLNQAIKLTIPDQERPTGLWMAASSRMPGWRIGLEETGTDASTSRRIASYSWIGLLIIATVAALAGFGMQVLRRQMRIAHLRTDLVAAVSHELKTPLASMKLLVDSLLRGEQLEPGRTRHYLQLVARENARLSRLIDNFLTFSRMERNRGRFDCTQVRPEAVVHAALDTIGERFPVEVEIAPNLPMVYADADAMVTVLLNLLENAYKYTGDDRWIQLKVWAQVGRVVFAVEDNGIGIAEREQKRIFRRFYQVDRRLARQTGGVGLGLSIVEFIVKAHSGQITVRSRPGEGSVFTISLPAVAARTAAGAVA
jgi:signal transduction histidine kinase